MNPVPAQLLGPMAIAPGWRSTMAREWARWDRSAPAKARAAEPGTVEGTGGKLRVVDGIGVISVTGPLTNDSSEWGEFITAIFGGTTYGSVWRALEQALVMPSVRKICMRYNTPGGDVDGLGELARFIYEARARKPIEAHAGNLCASAGLWLAVQAERFTAVEEAEVGSIGVRCSILDASKFYEANGFDEREVVSTISPGKRSKPLDDEVMARIQARIDALADLFVGAVARGRGVSSDSVISDFGQGDVLIASKALEVGLIDEVGDFNATLAAMNSSSGPRAAGPNRKVTAMQTTPKAEDVQAGSGMKCAGCEASLGDGPAYCKNCMDHEEPDGDEDDEAKAAKAFRGQVMALTGAADFDAALAAVKLGAEARAELLTVREAAEKQQRAATKAQVVSAVEAAVKSGRLSIGKVAGLVEFLDSDEDAARARTAFSAQDADGASVVGDLKSALEALASADFTARDARRISLYLDGLQASTPARREPPDDETNRNQVFDDPAFKKAAEAAGLDAGPARGKVMSIASIRDAQKKENR